MIGVVVVVGGDVFGDDRRVAVLVKVDHLRVGMV